jgi:hypothetical protein
MRRLPLVLLAAVGSTLAGQALAPGASSHRARGSASEVVRLPTAAQCLRGSTVRLIFSPRAGQTIASLSVRVGASEALQLAGLSGTGSLVIRVPNPGVRVSVTGSTSGGAFINKRRAYERCVPGVKPTPEPTAAPPSGGGGGGG